MVTTIEDSYCKEDNTLETLDATMRIDKFSYEKFTLT